MSTRILLLIAAISYVIAVSALAGPTPEDLRPARDPVMIYGGNPTAAKTARDTLVLMGPSGSGAPYVGDFEYTGKALDPSDLRTHGWTSYDMTQFTFSHWNVNNFDWSDLSPVPGYEPISGLYSAWCGDPDIESCDGAIDVTGGYGNGWNDILEWRGTVTDNAVSTTLTITGSANVFSEPGYDGTTLRIEVFDVGFVDVNYWDGVDPAVVINDVATYLPGEYMGGGADEVVVLFQFKADGGWDDQDCSFPSTGAILLDDMEITSDNGASTGGVVDFEGATLAPFNTRLPQGVGDFAKIWNYLGDEDRCATNNSYQVAFVDDGQVVPGTGGSPCQDWCYGPGGFIVTTTGGLAGPTSHIHNAVESPPMEWGDPAHNGALLSFLVYRHEDLSADAPGSFYTWSVRSVDTGDPADLERGGWQDRNFVYFGGPDYLRVGQVVSDLIVPSVTHVQIQLTVYELGWVWGWGGNDGYPAPYFDNVRFETYPVVGPGLATREIDLAQDNFPASGTIDMSDPSLLSVRFDGSQDISPPSHLNPSAADSFCFDAVVTRPDAVMDPATPTMHYKIKMNPVFDPYRTSAMPAEGTVVCGQVLNAAGLPVPDRYFGDLDDEGFLFPGDMVHYYVSATDRDTTDNSRETSIMPADTTGYSDYKDPMVYNPSFTVRCLPTISDLYGMQPPMLFWNDAGNRGGRDEWYMAFRNRGLVHGEYIDTYYTNGPTSGVGNGLGGRATALQLAGYDVMLYTAGDLSVNTISNGDLNSDSGPDADLLMTWLDSSSKRLMATGDNLASGLDDAGIATSTLLRDYFNVTVNNPDIRDLIDGQTAPVVMPTPTETVFHLVGSWVAYGGCPGLNTFDAVTTVGVGDRIAVWTDRSGIDGGYPYSACTVASGVGLDGTSEIISFPYDFAHIHTDPDEVVPTKADAKTAARVRILRSVLSRWGDGWVRPVSSTDLPQSDSLTAQHHPNPFNPLVNLSFTISRPGRLTVKVYDVRGRLVRSLFDEQVTEATDLVWNGKDDRGADTASGVYFYEARMHGEVQVGKLTLVR